MHRAGSAEGKDREVAWINAAFYCDCLDGASHVDVDHFTDAESSVLDRQAQPVGEVALYGRASTFNVKFHAAPGER